MRADSAQRAEVINATCSAIDAVAGACRFIASTASKHEKLYCWSAGDSLSVAALAHAVSRYDLSPFLPAFEVRNLSTLIHIAGVTGYAPHPRRSFTGGLLTDAVYRAEQACEIWQRLTSRTLNRCEGRHASASLRYMQRTAASLHQGASRPEMLRPRPA